ncbi:MAG: hypothetical protein ABI318_22080 [Chthoniobacteraceae bacterium]
MNDESLKHALEKLAIPAPDDAARERARRRAVTAFENRDAESGKIATQHSPMPWFRLATLAAAAACIALALVLAMRPRSTGDDAAAAISSDRADAKLLAEMEALFPGQLDAVVANGDQISVELAPEPGAAASQRLAITLSRGASTVRVLGYSGRRVCLVLDGRRACFEPLLTADGHVILAGDDFVWSRENPSALDGYRVLAHALTSL